MNRADRLVKRCTARNLCKDGERLQRACEQARYDFNQGGGSQEAFSAACLASREHYTACKRVRAVRAGAPRGEVMNRADLSGWVDVSGWLVLFEGGRATRISDEGKRDLEGDVRRAELAVVTGEIYTLTEQRVRVGEWSIGDSDESDATAPLLEVRA